MSCREPLGLGLLERTGGPAVEPGRVGVVSSPALDVAFRDPGVAAMTRRTCLLERRVRTRDPGVRLVETAPSRERAPERELSGPHFLEVVDPLAEKVERLSAPAPRSARRRPTSRRISASDEHTYPASTGRSSRRTSRRHRSARPPGPGRPAGGRAPRGCSGAARPSPGHRARRTASCALRLCAREEPAPLTLSDERGLKERVRDAPHVSRGLGELESTLDVVFGGSPVPLSPMTASAPVEDVRAEPIVGSAEPRRARAPGRGV